jgi:hypothetical protein
MNGRRDRAAFFSGWAPESVRIALVGRTVDLGVDFSIRLLCINIG